MSDNVPFKEYYGLELAQRLAGDISAVYPGFPAEHFLKKVAGQLEELELKDRVRLMAAALRETLPDSYPEAVEILRQILGPELASEAGMFNDGYFIMPIAQFVEDFGLNYFDESMAMLYEITKRFSSESAIRPYIEKYPQQTLAVLAGWTNDPNPHVRRLVSEGSRPRLPWAGQLKMFITDPRPTLELLELLRNDDSAYVRKSVANHLNDITKDYPGLVLDTLRRWNESPGEHTGWITRHALRTLVKKGDPAALSLLGYEAPQVRLENLHLEPATLTMPDDLCFSFELVSEAAAAQNLVVDFIIHFVRASGQRSPKVFKFRTLNLNPGERQSLERKFTIRPVTTRRYYPGQHRLEIQVNGEVLGGEEFALEV